MSLKEQFQNDLITAMKERDEGRVSVLRMLKSAIMKFEVSGTQKSVATEEEVLQILKKEVKQRRESIDQFEKGGRPDLAVLEYKELAMLEAYLPEMMGETQVQAIVEEVVNQMNASGPQDMGKVMGAVMAQLKGQADGTLVRTLVQQVLQKK